MNTIDGNINIISGGNFIASTSPTANISSDVSILSESSYFASGDPVGFICNEQSCSMVSIEGEFYGSANIDNYIYSELPTFKDFSVLDETIVSSISGHSNNVILRDNLSVINGDFFTGALLESYSSVITGKIKSNVNINSSILATIPIINGIFYSGSLISGNITEFSNFSLFTGKISTISEISEKLPAISGKFAGIVSAKTYIGDRNLVIIRGTVTGQRYSKNEIKSRLAVIRGQMSSPIDNILAEIGNDCYVLPVIDGKMYQELKTAGEIIGDMVIIDKCSFLKIVQDESRVLKNIRGEVR